MVCFFSDSNDIRQGRTIFCLRYLAIATAWLAISSRWSALAQHVEGAFSGGEGGGYVVLGVIEGEGIAGGAGDAEGLHEGLAAVVSGADGDAHLVQQGAEVVVVDAGDDDGDEGAAVFAGTEDVHAEGLEAIVQAVGECLFMGIDGGEPDFLHVAQGGGENDVAADVGGAGFVFEGKRVVGGLFEGDFANHLAAAEPGGQQLENLLPAPEGTGAGGCIDLVAGEGVVIAAELLHIHREVCGALGAVHQHEGGGVVALRIGDNLLHGVDGAEGIRDTGHGHDLGARGEETVVGLHIELQLCGERHGTQHSAGAAAEHLPGDDVGVVRIGGDDNLIAGGDKAGERKGLRHEVDAGRAAAGEDELSRRRGTEESSYGFAGSLVFLCGQAAEVVSTAVNVRVLLLIVAAGGFEHAGGFVRGGGVVQIHQRALADAGGKDGELGAVVHHFTSSLMCSTMRQADSGT